MTRQKNGTEFYPVSKPSIGETEVEYVTDAVKSGWISSIGPYVTRFESDFAKFCDVKHALAVANGTVALHLALKGLNIGPGDEVIVPDLSFIATANAVLMAGATPVFCDIDSETLCIDPDLITSLITPATKAIMPVHLYGHPANMDRIVEIAAAHCLKVIEDAAEAHGAKVRGRPVGGLGDCATFSFYGNKNLTTGEGGMITSNDRAFIEQCRSLRDHAMNTSRRYWHDELGYNYRITNLQAALGCAQLERAQELLGCRQEILNHYRRCLAGIPGLRLNRTAPWATSTCWLVCVEFEGLSEERRLQLMSLLRENGIDTRPYFYPMSDMPYMSPAKTPIAHSVAPTGLSLPTYIDLKEDDIERIVTDLISSSRGLGILD